MRRGLVWAALMGVLLLAGCGDRADRSEAAAASPTAPAAGTPRPTLTIWADESAADAVSATARRFEATSGTEVVVTPTTPTKMRKDLPKLAPRGQGPDLLLGPSDWVGALSDAGLIRSVDVDGQSARFRPLALAAFTYRDRLFGIPITTHGPVLLRNTDLAPKVPDSIDSMAKRGLALVSDKDADVAIALPVGKRGDAYHWYPMLSASGGYIFERNRDGTYNPDSIGVDEAGSVRAARELADLADRDVIDPAITQKKAIKTFAAGRAPYLIAGPSALDRIGADIPLAVSAVPGDRPSRAAGRAMVSATGFMLSSFARNAPAARQFLSGTVLTTAAMDELTARGTQVPAWQESFVGASADPAVRALDEIQQAGQPSPNLPYMDSVWRAMDAAQRAIVTGEEPGRAMERAATKVADVVAAH